MPLSAGVYDHVKGARGRTAREKAVHRIKKSFEDTLRATRRNDVFLTLGFVPIAEALESMQRYRCKAFNPLPGDVGKFIIDLLWCVFFRWGGDPSTSLGPYLREASGPR